MTAYWPAPETVATRSPRRLATGLVVLALIDVLALVAGLAAYAVRRDVRLATPRDIRTVVPELTEFVEDERGLRFTSRVEVVLLDDAAFRARLTQEEPADTETDEPEPEAGATLQALGLIAPGTDLDAEVDKLTGGSVAGFYDAEADELVVRGDRATPLVRAVLVHELTHALQDQHFDLHRPELDERDDESRLGFLGLVEGDANLVEEAYRDQLSDDDLADLEREETELYGDAASGAPEVLVVLLGFPYEIGPSFVRALRDARGVRGLNAAFERPPVSSEQLLHIRSYLGGDAPVAVTPPAARGTVVVDRGVLGELGLLLLLGMGGDRDFAEVFPDVDQWGGDRYVTWREGAAACTAATIAMEGEDAARELRTALGEWAAGRTRVTVAGRGREVRLDACA